MQHETQSTINAWANKAFGPSTNWQAAYQRTIAEVGEFICACASRELPQALQEAADIVITLYRFAAVVGFDLQAEIDRKMEINRHRNWIAAGDGTGVHIRDGSIQGGP